jgi:hypothetical protein
VPSEIHRRINELESLTNGKQTKFVIRPDSHVAADPLPPVAQAAVGGVPATDQLSTPTAWSGAWKRLRLRDGDRGEMPILIISSMSVKPALLRTAGVHVTAPVGV